MMPSTAPQGAEPHRLHPRRHGDHPRGLGAVSRGRLMGDPSSPPPTRAEQPGRGAGPARSRLAAGHRRRPARACAAGSWWRWRGRSPPPRSRPSRWWWPTGRPTTTKRRRTTSQLRKCPGRSGHPARPPRDPRAGAAHRRRRVRPRRPPAAGRGRRGRGSPTRSSGWEAGWTTSRAGWTRSSVSSRPTRTRPRGPTTRSPSSARARRPEGRPRKRGAPLADAPRSSLLDVTAAFSLRSVEPLPTNPADGASGGLRLAGPSTYLAAGHLQGPKRSVTQLRTTSFPWSLN